MIAELLTCHLLDLSHTRAKNRLEKTNYPYEILDQIEKLVLEVGLSLPKEEYEQTASDVWIAKDVKISRNVTLCGPLIVDHETEIRPGAYLRGNVLIGKGCVVGNSTEIKNAILFDGAKAPHFNYVGDSLLGYRAHMGAGSVTSNVKLDHGEVVWKIGQTRLITRRKKCGAVLGDFAEIGCHAVLNPGTVIGRNAYVYPLSSIRGYIPSDSIWKGHSAETKK